MVGTRPLRSSETFVFLHIIYSQTQFTKAKMNYESLLKETEHIEEILSGETPQATSTFLCSAEKKLVVLGEVVAKLKKKSELPFDKRLMNAETCSAVGEFVAAFTALKDRLSVLRQAIDALEADASVNPEEEGGPAVISNENVAVKGGTECMIDRAAADGIGNATVDSSASATTAHTNTSAVAGSAELDLIVKIVETGQELKMNIAAEATGAELKAKAYDEITDLPLSGLTAIVSGKVLADSSVLTTAGITNGTVIFLGAKKSPNKEKKLSAATSGLPVTVTANLVASGLALQITLSERAPTVADFKRKVAASVTELPVTAQTAVFNGKVLLDTMVLSDAGVTNGAVLFVGATNVTRPAAAILSAATTVPSNSEEDAPASTDVRPREEVLAQMVSAIKTLRESTTHSTLVIAVKLVWTLIDNLIMHPLEEKYRRVRMGNAVMNSRLFSKRGGTEALLAAGFQKQDDVLVVIGKPNPCLPEIRDMLREALAVHGFPVGVK